MKPHLFRTISILVLLTGSLVSAAEPNADQLLRQMSAKLAAAHSFSFQAQREIDPALVEGRDVPEKARVVVAVQRPNQLAATSVSKEGTRRFVADGRTLSILDEKNHTYAAVPMPPTIDALVAKLDEEYGFTPPLAEFAVKNPYADFRKQAGSVAYAGQEKLSTGFLGWGSVTCHRLALKGKEADAELWIAVGDSLPRKLIATFHRAGHPQLRVEFSAWNLAAPVTAGDFAFHPPAGAQKVEMWTTARMESPTQKATARKQ